MLGSSEESCLELRPSLNNMAFSHAGCTIHVSEFLKYIFGFRPRCIFGLLYMALVEIFQSGYKKI